MDLAYRVTFPITLPLAQGNDHGISPNQKLCKATYYLEDVISSVFLPIVHELAL